MRHVLSLGLGALFLVAAPVQADVTIQFLDVGQGDSILVHTDEGKTVLIDGGGYEGGPVVLEALADLAEDRIDLVIATHPHLDHIGGLLAVLEKVPVRTYLDPGLAHTTETYKTLVGLIADKKIKGLRGRTGRKIEVGSEATIELLGPSEPLLSETRSDLDANSVVVRLSVGEIDVLLLGDAEPATIDRLLGNGLRSAEILKVAHHGSRYGTSSALLSAVGPSAAVISSGVGNRYGHPDGQTMAALSDAGVRVYRTDRQGTVVLKTNGKTFSIHAVGKAKTVEPPVTTAAAGVALATPAGDAKFHAGRRSKVFHPAGCNHLIRIKPGDIVEFASRNEALASGRRDGKGCNGARQTDASTNTTVDRPAAAGAFVASKRSKVYHPAACAHVGRIKEANRIAFTTEEEAVASGRRPGKGCSGAADGGKKVEP